MKKVQQMTRLLAAGLLLSGLSAGLFAQEQKEKQGEADRMASASSITGCLGKDASGAYSLTDEATGLKTAVTGAADLEKHSANHKVTLMGAAKTDATGKPVFEVSKLIHVSDTCKAPSQQ